jgi:hypothetical protein
VGQGWVIEGHFPLTGLLGDDKAVQVKASMATFESIDQ